MTRRKLHFPLWLAIAWLANAADAGTSWVNDFESADLKGIQFQPLQFGLRSSTNTSTLTTAHIFGGALNMKFNHSPIKPWTPALAQQATSMALDRTKHYVIKLQLEVESDTLDGVPMTLRWDDGGGDSTPGFNGTEQVAFVAYPNIGRRTFTFYTNDTTTWPAFAHFGKDPGDNADIQFWLLLPGNQHPNPADLDNHAFRIHHIEFKEYVATAPEPLVIASYFPAETTREVSHQNGIWGLYNTSKTDPTHYSVQYSGDTYITTDKKECANTFYPRIGLFDASDPNIIEYHVLQAKASGVDGFAIENAVPGSSTWRVQMNDVMYVMSDVVKDMHFEFQVGLNFLPNVYGEWRKDDFTPQWTTREQMRVQMQLDMKQWLDDIYAGRQTGIWIAGRPAILVFNISNCNLDCDLPCPPAVDPVTDSTMRNCDFDAMRDFLNNNGWGSPSASALLDPVFLGNNAYFANNLVGSIEGAFPWTSAQWNGGLSELPPWEHFNTRSSIVNSYLNAYYNGCMNWFGTGRMPYFMGGALRGFDDHKGHSWGTDDVKRYIASDLGETLDDSCASFENQSATGTPLLFVVEWPEHKEATGVDPNREQGYAHMERLASRIWNWRGLPLNYNPTLLRMPERLLGVRRTIEFLIKAGYADTDPAITALSAQANAASWAIHDLNEVDADVELDAAESAAQSLVAGLTTTWIDLGWSYGGDCSSIVQSWPSSPTTVSTGGKTGLAFTSPNGGFLRYRITDPAKRAAINDGYFVGRLRIEYLDQGTNWIYSGTDNDLPQVFQFYWAKDLARFLAKGSAQWRRVEYDLVNIDFHMGLDGSSDLEFQEQLRQGATYQSGLSTVQILGTVYKRP